MANEKRPIDANALKEKLKGHHDFFVDGCGGFRYLTPKDKARGDEIDNCIAEIVNAPTVDAVEVVRCKDCEYFRIEPDDFLGVCKCGAIATNYGGEIYPEREHFCSYGERREGE